MRWPWTEIALAVLDPRRLLPVPGHDDEAAQCPPVDDLTLSRTALSREEFRPGSLGRHPPSLFCQRGNFSVKHTPEDSLRTVMPPPIFAR